MTRVRRRSHRNEALMADVERRPDGSYVLRSRQPLQPYRRRATDGLLSWARATPDTPLFAWRAPDGSIGTLTYAETCERVCRVGQALLDRQASSDKPVVMLSGNGIDCAVLTLAALHVGACAVPLSPAYSLVSRDFSLLRHVFADLRPSLVFAEDGAQFGNALQAVVPKEVEIVVSVNPPGSTAATPFSMLCGTAPTAAVQEANARVEPDTIAKILFTSGSTGFPKGVINTHRMLTSNQQMLAQALPVLVGNRPVLVDWLPWHHTFGGNHNFGLVVDHGGTLFIDRGKPLPGLLEESVQNLRAYPPTVYLNVPRGFEELVRTLRADRDFRERFFSRLQVCFYAAASLAQNVADELQAIGFETCGRRIPLVTALGATETAPLAIARDWDSAWANCVGLPVPGLEAKLVPESDRFELRVRGPNVTPGYWNDTAQTAEAFDDEGFYRLGDAVRFVDDQDVNEGLLFDGRIAEDFKLATGTWVRVGALRARVVAHFAPMVQDTVIAGHDRDELGMLIVPDVEACRACCPELGPEADRRDVLRQEAVRARFQSLLRSFAAVSTGSANRIVRAVILDEPPSLDAQEVTDKGSLNQRAILTRRAPLVQALYEATPGPEVITL
jgi:feruloyl-CoA synthase